MLGFHREDAARDVGLFLNPWQVFADDPTTRVSPAFAATLFLTWAEELGGLVEPGIGMAWLNDDGEPVEWIWDPGSLFFRGVPFPTRLDPPEPQ